MKKSPVTTKAERRQRRKRPRMKVHGAAVKQIQRLIVRRGRRLHGFKV